MLFLSTKNPKPISQQKTNHFLPVAAQNIPAYK